MLICLCRSVSEQDILDAIETGTFSELFDRTRLGTECGACVNTIRLLLEENYHEQDTTDSYD